MIEDSENWEASFYAEFSGVVGFSGKKASRIYSVISNALDTTLPLIRDTVPDQTEQENAVLEIAQDIFDRQKGSTQMLTHTVRQTPFCML